MTKTIYNFFLQIILQKTIREGLLLALPFIIIGSMALAIRSVPISSYQIFIKTIADGHLYYILTSLHTYTLLTIPLILIFTMSIAFGRAVCQDTKEILFYPIISFLSYLIFLAPYKSLSFLDTFNAMQTLIATVITIFSCSIFYFFSNWKYTDLKYYLKTYNHTFNIIYRMILPANIVFLIFAALHLFLNSNFKDIAANIHIQLFNYLGNNFFSAAICILIEHCYWFIGIHGSNMLDVVTTNIFQFHMLENLTNINLGLVPKEIYTKTFLDVFIGIGGAGSIWSLIISIFLFAKLPHTRRIAKLSILPSLFNISEIIIIGLPIICNGFLLIPFLLVPLSNLFFSSIAMQFGLVPVTTHIVEWTTPPLLNGYLSTGSISGSILQIFIISIGVFIYRPFILKYELNEDLKLKNLFKSLIEEVVYCEKLGKTPALLTNNDFADIAKLLSSDLHQALTKKELQLFYQPQVNYNGTIYGGEALLRWKHPQFGYIYPPLIIFLAKENNWLDELGMYIIEQTCKDLEYLNRKLNHPIKLSVNVAPPQLYNKYFCQDVRILLAKYNFGNSILAFELTEQIALSTTREIMNRLNEIKRMGILLSMDDFGMGHSSVMYLQNSDFDIVKLDGNLTKKVLSSDRSVDIIKAITQLSKKFNFKVVAEFVETKEQRDKLADLGCHIYQGWLYSQAIPLEVFLRFLKENHQ